MNRNQKILAPVLILAIIAVMAVVGYFLLTKSGKYTTTSSTSKSYPSIQDSADLDAAESDLDSTDTNQVDTELNQLSSDVSVF
jgi:hypothetical protein